MLFFTFVVDIGANTLFLLIYYGTSLLRNEVTAPSSTHMKFVSYSGMAVPLHGYDSSSSWERRFLFMGTTVPLHGNDGSSSWERRFLFMGTMVSLHGNDGFPSWERWFLFMGTVVPFYRHCIISL